MNEISKIGGTARRTMIQNRLWRPVKRRRAEETLEDKAAPAAGAEEGDGDRCRCDETGCRVHNSG